MTASTSDLAHDLPEVEPGMLLQPEILWQQRATLAGNVLARLRIAADGVPLTGQLLKIEPVPDRQDLRLKFQFPWSRLPSETSIQARLFPYDSRHKTFVNLYQGDHLARQEILEGNQIAITMPLASQSIGAVVRQFLYEGVHHIFIGPDHILFIVGLLLLGGTLRRLLTIITAFTVAHSITLGLATFGIVNPSPRLIEPLIALSIVFVGVHALLGRKSTDTRVLFAFGFGLVHGFGFASVLQEMALPRAALGWSLAAFNGGVEIGQMCIVACVAPLLTLLCRRDPVAGARTVFALALAVVTVGSFWFFQRTIG
ncbi:MAG: HupE/UreJ family protein [Verrucomicrobiota bacterium]